MSAAEREGGLQDSGSDSYDRFIGRYSKPLAVALADAAGIAPDMRALDVGCGPGALTAELVRRLGRGGVGAVDPSATFVEACARRTPGVDVRVGPAEDLPFGTGSFDAALMQLVLNFVDDPHVSAAEARRVVRSGGTVTACVWDDDGGVRMLRLFWEAVAAVDPSAAGENKVMRFGHDGEIGDLFREAGLSEVATGSLEVQAAYAGFEDLWNPFVEWAGPVGQFCRSLEPERLAAIREQLRMRVGAPAGSFTLPARAWYATGRV
ncbi:MAG: class I SAM-dependent methyltransferase [Acidobacteriota bacterium]|nr:class I SAM-dependent methyltransferase [Acidobacteriota bacterium]